MTDLQTAYNQAAAPEIVGASSNEEFIMPQGWESYDYDQLENLLSEMNSSISQGGGNKNQGLKAMKKKIIDKMGSMGYSGKVDKSPIRKGWKLTATNEDPKTGKKKKAFEVKVKMDSNGTPSATYRMWNGEKFDPKIAVMALDALKTGGADYFTCPPAIDIGGSEYVAFMEAAGKTLMVPICKSAKYPKAIELDADAVKKILEAAEKNNTDTEKMSQFKERLLGVLQEQENYKRAEAQRKGSSYATNSVLQTEMDKLSATRLAQFNLKYLSNLEKGIRSQATKEATGQPNGWDFIETQAALRAATNIAEYMTTSNLHYDESMKPTFDRMFQIKMQEHKESISNQLRNRSSNDNEAKKEIRSATEALVGETVRTTEELHGVKLSLGKDIARISTRYTLDKSTTTTYEGKSATALPNTHPRTTGRGAIPPTRGGTSYS